MPALRSRPALPATARAHAATRSLRARECAMPDHRRLAILIRHRKAAHVTLAQMACACGLEGSRAYESVSAWERGEARGARG